MRFGHIELFVENPLSSKDFYCDVLGFEVEAIQGERFVWLKSGNTEVLLRPGKREEPTADYASGRCGFVIYTDDLTGTMDRLTARGLTFCGTDGSDCCPTFTDPDGNWFQLVNPEQAH